MEPNQQSDFQKPVLKGEMVEPLLRPLPQRICNSEGLVHHFSMILLLASLKPRHLPPMSLQPEPSFEACQFNSMAMALTCPPPASTVTIAASPNDVTFASPMSSQNIEPCSSQNAILAHLEHRRLICPAEQRILPRPPFDTGPNLSKNICNNSCHRRFATKTSGKQHS